MSQQVNIEDIFDKINWSKVSDNPEVIELIKQAEILQSKIRSIDKGALVKFYLELLNVDCVVPE